MATQIAKGGRKRTLPPPPAAADTLGNLDEPEFSTPAPKKGRAAKKVDGRTLRRTGRTEQFSTRVHPDFKKKIYALSDKTGKQYNEILEESLALFENNL